MHSNTHKNLLEGRLPPLTDRLLQQIAQDSLKNIELDTQLE